MSNEEIKFGPNEAKGREFKKNGAWLFLQVGNDKFYAKVDTEEVAKARRGEWFEAFHLVAASMNGQGMLVAPLLGILDPTNFNGAQVSSLSFLHPQAAARLDEMVQKKYDPPTVIAAKASDVPPAGKIHLA